MVKIKLYRIFHLGESGAHSHEVEELSFMVLCHSEKIVQRFMSILNFFSSWTFQQDPVNLL